MFSLRGITVPPKSKRFDVVRLILDKIGSTLSDGDILVISSKFLAISEGRVARLDSVRTSRQAKDIAERYHVDERLCELIIRESDEIIGGIPGFILTSKEGILTPNAGIDKSNIEHGMVVLYPRRPDQLARMIRNAIKFSTGASVGVVVCDSRLSPTRRGTTGVTLAASGIEAILDMRGRKDLFGNVLKVTSQAIADDLSSAAEVLMGESDEATPIVLIRGVRQGVVRDVDYSPGKFAISADDCVYMRSLGRGRAGADPPDRLLGAQV